MCSARQVDYEIVRGRQKTKERLLRFDTIEHREQQLNRIEEKGAINFEKENMFIG